MPDKSKWQERKTTLRESDGRIVALQREDQSRETKLFRLGRIARRDCQRLGEGAPGTFDFLGFTHYCGTSRAIAIQAEAEDGQEEVQGESA